jgi:transposase
MRRFSAWSFLIKVGHRNFLLSTKRNHVRRTFATKTRYKRTE